jgi:site-specific recombinase XerD
MDMAFISIYHDTRRVKQNGKFPVKLRVFVKNPRRQILYPIGYEYSKEEFYNVWEARRPKPEHVDTRLALQEVERIANNVARKINPFSFDKFEALFFRKPGQGINLSYLYQNHILRLRKKQSLGTAESYRLSERSIKEYFENRTRKKYNEVNLLDITTEMLSEYERYMVHDKRLSKTTVGIYLRPLKALWNLAIDENEIERERYPFGVRKYQIPTSKNTKKALNKSELGLLFGYDAKTVFQKKARDFWFFSYCCNGMNIKDIALLKNKDISNGQISFYRAKTAQTARTGTRQIIVPINEFSNKVIEQYRVQGESEDFVFDIIKRGMSPEQQRASIQNFTRFINQHLNVLCKANDFPHKISTYWARHSFASNYIAAGANVLEAMESLGHSSIQTTQNYLRSFEGDEKRKLTESLMNF